MENCSEYPVADWEDDRGLGLFMGNAYKAWFDCKTKHYETVKLLKEEINGRR